jgi:hypothetical protein
MRQLVKKMDTKNPVPHGTGFSFSGCLRFLNFFQGLDTDNAFSAAMATKTNYTVNLSIDGVVTTDTNVFTRMEPGTTLAHDDAAGGYNLTVVCFGAQALGVGITTVVGRTGTFFMCM